jgi:phenylacetic acid degradation operon negative regulatory protein
MSTATTVPTDELAHAEQPVGSARAVLLTVLGDAVLPTGGSVWLATLTAVASDLGIQPTATRQALRRLVAQELVLPQRHGRLARYELTPTGRRRLEEAAERIYLRRPLTWDGRWHLLSWPRGGGASTALRRELRWLGYGELDDGTWCCPWDLGTRLDAVLAKHDADRAAHRFTAALDGDDRELAGQAYDLRALREAHRSFLADAESPAEPADDRAALVARLALVHRWRKLLFLDPGLPTELLPADWLGDRAGAAFFAAYRALEAPAWRHYLAVAAATDPAGDAPPAPTSNLARATTATAVPAPRASDAPHRDRRGATGGARATGSRPMGEAATDRRPDDPATDDPGREREFLALLHGGRRIEPSDWMPSTYRRLNIRSSRCTPTRRSWAPCRSASGSPGPRRCAASGRWPPRSRTRSATRT